VEFLEVVLAGEPAGWGIWEELKLDDFRRVSGWLLFFDGVGQTAKRYAFYEAALVWLEFRYDGRGTAGEQAATQVELHFSPATVEVDGQRVEAHSRIPWKTDPHTSFRALTKPPDPEPSAHLAALLTATKVVAEEVGTGLLKKVITPAGEVATELLGVGLAALVRTASLTAGLLLTPTNSRDDPGYAAEWELYRRNHGTPLTPAQLRLAQLERLHAQGDLTTGEEAEMIALLASVKGIHVHHLGELTVASAASNKPKPSKPYKNKKKLLGNGPSKQPSKRTAYLGRTPSKSSATGKEVVKRMEAEGKIQADSLGEKQVLGPDNKWHAIGKTDMGHLHDAVSWWNAEGRKHGPKSPEVRKWMLDSDNYELEPSSINRSRGAKLKDRYLPPLK
jgi:hypothetical protein